MNEYFSADDLMIHLIVIQPLLIWNIVPLWIYESDCAIKELLKNPSSVASSLPTPSRFKPSSDNNQIKAEESNGRNIVADESITNDIASSYKNTYINVTKIVYFPHNDTLIATYNCVLKGNENSPILSQTKEVPNYSVCTFGKQNVSFYYTLNKL